MVTTLQLSQKYARIVYFEKEVCARHEGTLCYGCMARIGFNEFVWYVRKKISFCRSCYESFEPIKKICCEGCKHE